MEPKKKLSDTVKLAIIAGIVTLGQAYMSVRINNVNSKVNDVVQKVDTVHKVVNSRMDEMLLLVEEKGKEAVRDSIEKK